MTLTGNTFYFAWEPALIAWLQSHIPASLISIISQFSFFGETVIFVLILGTLYWCIDKKTCRTVALSLFMGNSFTGMIKNIALRRRPYFDHENIRILRIVEPGADPYDISAQGYSFPSGHSSNATSAYPSLAYRIRRKWMTVLAICLPLLTGFSRIVVGAHYPTDVLTGWVLGLLSFLLVVFLESKIKRSEILYAVLILLTLPGFFYCRSNDYFTIEGMLIGFCLGTLFEERFVRFSMTDSLAENFIRLVLGFGLFAAMNTLLKLPFSKAFLDSGTYAALLVRSGRYAVIAFIEFGVYPMFFRPLAQLVSSRKQI